VLLSAQGVSFEHGEWAEVLAKAKSEKKLIFMDAYTTWCGPCKMMSRNVFPNENVGTFYNENFVNVKMDMERGEGVGLAKKYMVYAYPTLLYIDYSGEVVHRTAGYFGAEDFIELGKTAMKPTGRLGGLRDSYAKGTREPEFLMKYTESLAMAMDQSYVDVANEYINTQGDLGTEQNMNFIMEYVDDPMSKGFEYFSTNKKVFEDKYGFEAVDGKLQNALGAFIENDPNQPYENIEKLINKLYPNDGKKIAASYKMAYSRQQGDRDGYAKAAVAYFKAYPSKNADELNEAAWTFYQVVDDKKMLKQAVKWAKKSVKIDEGYYNMDTLAALYSKLKKKKKTIKYGRKAIALAQKNGEDFSETQRLIDEAYNM